MNPQMGGSKICKPDHRRLRHRSGNAIFELQELGMQFFEFYGILELEIFLYVFEKYPIFNTSEI